MGKLWSEEEIEHLKKLYEYEGLSVSELLPIFNKNFNRSYEALSVKIGRLKLRHTKEQISLLKSRLNTGENNGMFGKPSAMKGLTKENSEIVKIKSEKLSRTKKELFKLGLLPDISGNKNPMFGKIPWSKGLTKYNDERLLNIGLKSSSYKKEEWKNKSLEEKEFIIQRLNNAMIQVIKPTKIENKIQQFLTENQFNFKVNYPISIFRADFYLTDHNLVIECDGDYWHANPLFYSSNQLDIIQLKNLDRDKRKEKLFNEKNINYIRFWEYDIKYNFDLIKDKIWEKLQRK